MTRRDSDFGDDAATALVGILVIGVVALVAAAVTGIVAILAEIVDVYTTNGDADTSVARALWYVLAGFLLILAGCAIFAVAVPGGLTSALVVGGIATTIFFVTVEVYGHIGQAESGPVALPEDLDAYLEFDRDSSQAWWRSDVG